MKTNKTINKLKAYSATALAVVASSSIANAEIISNVINKDITDSSFDLDLNGDGTIDYTFSANINTTFTNIGSSSGGPGAQTNWTWNWVGASAYVSFTANIIANGTNAIATSGGFGTVKGFEGSSIIGGSQDFIGGTNTIGGLWFGEWRGRSYVMNNGERGKYSNYSSSSWSASNWRLAEHDDKYVGLKFMIDGNVHYGWANFSMSGPGTRTQDLNATLIGYAYEDNSGTKFTGSPVLGVKKQDANKVNIYSFNKGVYISNSEKGASINVYDLLGKQVYSGIVKGAESKIDMSGHQGTYIVRINDTARKVYVN